MADTSNAPAKDPLTSPVEGEGLEQTETPPEGETKPVKEPEPPAGSKSWEHALQQRQELLKKEKAQRESVQTELAETKKRLEDLELQGLGETERLRVEAERARQEVEILKQEKQVEEVKKEYRRFLVEKEADNPKTVTFLRRQMDKDIYPVQGGTVEEFNSNFEDFANEFEGKAPQGKTSASSPAYTSPEEVDISKLSAKEMRNILPIAEKE
jgi:hypothetical protein